MRIVVGLGNPGAKYERSRHNLGFQVLDRVAQKLKLTFAQGEGEYLEARGSERGEAFVLVKPTTYMNLSGEALREFHARGELYLARLLVVVDDLDLPSGQLRLRTKGSAG